LNGRCVTGAGVVEGMMLGIEEDDGKMSSIKGSRAVSKGEVIGLSVGQNDDEEDDELDPPAQNLAMQVLRIQRTE